MSANKSAKEVEQDHIAAMGAELGPLYHALHNEVIWLHAKWSEYRKLYAHSSARIGALNDVAGFFFRVVQDVLWDDVLLHLVRLIDPPKSGGKDNLTVSRLPEAITEKDFADKVRDLVCAAQGSASFASEWRNRHLAHRDLALALGTGAAQLPRASRRDVEEALGALRAVMNEVHARYLKGHVGFENFIAPTGADALVSYLSMAARAEEQRRVRLRGGRPLPEDLERPSDD